MSVKICGLRREEDLAAVADTGARYAGFVFFPKSPRAVSLDEAAALMPLAPVGLAKVALVVDADDTLIDAITHRLPVDILQLHGSETPERVVQLRNRTGLPVMKAVGVASEADLPKLADYGSVSDMLLVDAKPPKDAVLPGGNGVAFDWKLIAGRRWPVPWMLAGGLNPENVAEAIRLTGAPAVDVSSGVESEPGVKDAAKIRAFIEAAETRTDAPPRLR
ncbi:phosphoribosylanthranilate isomerase [Paracoccaceae bacterium GXU_MW_L88]